MVPIVASASTSSAPGDVTFRAILCFAPLAPAKPRFSKSAALPDCRPSYRLTAKNLGVDPNNSAQGFKMKTVKPDPRFLNFPDSTSVAHSSTSILLLSGLKGSAAMRYVLGPARLTSSTVPASTRAM